MKKKAQKQRSTAIGLGFIDLLAITLVVVILQITTIIYTGNNETPPRPVAYNVNVYQPAEKPKSTADHLGFLMIEKYLLLWKNDLSSNDKLMRDYFNVEKEQWERRKNWGYNEPISVYHLQTIANFIDEVRNKLGIDIQIDHPSGFPPRINVFFKENTQPFKMEIGFNRCDASSNNTKNLYQNKYVHPILVKWAILSNNPIKGSSLFEASKNNVSEWSNSGQFTLLAEGKIPGESNCKNKTPAQCANDPKQRLTFISVKLEFNGKSLHITNGHGQVFNAR